MKLQLILSILAMLAILAPFAIANLKGGREECHNTDLTVGTHTNGILPLVCETAALTRYLLVQKGTSNVQIIANIATTRPIGVCLDEPAVADGAAVALLGCVQGTLRMVASGAISVGAAVYTDAAGKVTATAAAGCYRVGFALTQTTTDGDLIEVAHHAAVAVSVPSVVVATADTAVTALQATGGAVLSNAGASGAVVFALPAALQGMRVTALVEAAQELSLDPNGTQTIALPSSGVQSAAGKKITADAIGEKVDLICITAGTWDVISYSGTWTAEG